MKSAKLGVLFRTSFSDHGLNDLSLKLYVPKAEILIQPTLIGSEFLISFRQYKKIRQPN